MAWSRDQPVLCPILVGRDEALGVLGRRLEQVNAGVGQMLLVSGEAGIGKSRLVAEAKDRAKSAGYLILTGRCFEPDRTLPYAPLLDLLCTYLGATLTAEVGAVRGTIARLLPEFADQLPDLTPGGARSEIDPEQDKRHIVRTLIAFLIGLATARPVLMVIEDVHWSDETSLELLLGLARRILDRPVLLLLTYRGDEAHPELQRLLAELDRDRLATDIALGRLTSAEVETMIRATFALNRPVRAEFRDLLVSLTDGNPFFVEEVLKSLVAAGDIVHSAEGWTRAEISELRAPRSVQDAVRRRVERLSEPTRHALQLAAVAGRRFDFALLQDLLQIDEIALLTRIKELIAAQLVVEETADRFAFRHALTRQAILDELLSRERKLLHRRVAEAMERVYADAADGHLGDFSYHYAAAGVWPKVIDYGQRAGKQALAMQTPRAAVEHFTRAIEACQTLGLPPVGALYRFRGQANETLGEFQAARGDFEAALTAARTAHDRAAEWQALIDLGFLWAARDYAATGDFYNQALALAREIGDPALVARSLNRVGNWLLNSGWPEEARRYHQDALAAFEAMGDSRGAAETLDLLVGTAALGGDTHLARSYAERAVTLCRALGDRRRVSFNLVMQTTLSDNDLFYWIEVVDGVIPPDPFPPAAEAVTIAREIGWSAGEAFALTCQATAFGTVGDYTRGLAAARHGLAIADEIGHRQWSACGHLGFGALYADLFALPLARRHAEQAISLAREVQAAFFRENPGVILASTFLQEDEFARAEAVLNEYFGRGCHSLPQADRLARKVRAELALARGDPAAALPMIDQLVGEMIGSAPGIIIPTLESLRGEALFALGQPEAALGVLMAALRAAETRGMLPLLWRLHALLGRLYRATGRAAEAERAFMAARAIIDGIMANLPDDPVPELGGVSLGDHFRGAIAGLVPGLRPRTPRQATKLAYGGLTAREREIAVLIAGGNSNREIGAALFISERTVTTHVTNILAKLDCTTRAQIATWVGELGLTGENPVSSRE